MNYNKRVVFFALSATLLLLAVSLYKEITGRALPGFAGISLLADVMRPPAATEAHTTAGKENPSENLPPVSANKSAWQLPGLLTAFQDTAAPALPQLMERLQALRQGRRRKVRIAWLGDSMIEGDLVTQTVRRRLQAYFGGSGAGFVKMQSLDSRSRATVTLRTEGVWREEKFEKPKTVHTVPLFFSGHTFFAGGGTTRIQDNSAKSGTGATLVKYLIYGGAPGRFTATVNDSNAVSFAAPNSYNRLVIDSSDNPQVSVRTDASGLPLYGISIESATGLVLDNFSFRGITGVELLQLDTALLQSMMAQEPYDLVVLQYGVNLLFRPTDTQYPWYRQKMEPVLRQLKSALPGAEFLVISAGDRAFRYEGEWKTGMGVDSLVALQAQIANAFGMAFFNLYQTMGGAGSVVRWANADPPQANKDYIHPNHKGAEIIGNALANAFEADFRKWQTQRGAPATAGR